MPLKEENKELTAFVVLWGQYQWKQECSFALSAALKLSKG
jgi:hypothetical protein